MNGVRTSIENYTDLHLQQQVYRKILDAFSFPGSILELCEPSETHSPDARHLEALLRILATLADANSTVCDHAEVVPHEISQALGYRSVPADQADFVVSDASKNYVPFEPRIGNLSRPDLGATLIWLCEKIGKGDQQLEISGPGVPSVVRLDIGGLNLDWLEARATWVARFPLGVDVLMCDSKRIVGLPRTSAIRICC